MPIPSPAQAIVTSATAAAATDGSADLPPLSTLGPLATDTTTVASPATTLPPVITEVSCSTFFRTVDTSPPADGPVLSFTSEQTQTAEFSDMRLTAMATGQQSELDSLFIRVVTLPDEAQVFGGLYQFPVDPNINSFGATGQGFTGLLYVYNPASGSELQVFCAAS